MFPIPHLQHPFDICLNFRYSEKALILEGVFTSTQNTILFFNQSNSVNLLSWPPLLT